MIKLRTLKTLCFLRISICHFISIISLQHRCCLVVSLNFVDNKKKVEINNKVIVI